MSGFKRAEKSQSKLRIAIDGPSGAGKTWTSMTLASVFAQGAPFAVIDTERGSASKYADHFTFDVMELTEYSPTAYIAAMREAESAGYPALVIDSITHEWNGRGGVLDIVEDEKKRLRAQSSFQAWNKGKGEHQKFIDAMLGTNLHLVVTMRSKMEHALSQSDSGKTEVKKLGMAPVQSDGMEYEFDVVADMDLEHTLIVSKSRFKEIADAVVRKPDDAFALKLYEWAMSGSPKARVISQELRDAWTIVQTAAIMSGLDMPDIDPSLTDDQIKAAGKEWRAKIDALGTKTEVVSES